jgi:lipoyl(octanoyl) transferase
MGPVDFVRRMEEALIRLCGEFGVQAGRIAGLTGVWCGLGAEGGEGLDAGGEGRDTSAGRKIGAIGIHVSRGITSHGFAFNVTTNLRDFKLIVPCGIADHAVTSLELEVAQPETLPGLESIAHRAARQFGLVLDQQVLAVESLEALRAQMEAAPASFPAEDTPMQVPREVERLRRTEDRPTRA